jgi:hypothetical protein
MLLVAGGLVLFATLFYLDARGEERRMEQRQVTRDAQIQRGDRTVERSTTGQLVSSKLKPVDDEWILKRLDRWGRSQDMPFLGPNKAQVFRQLVNSLPQK